MNLTQVINSQRVAIANDEIKKNYAVVPFTRGSDKKRKDQSDLIFFNFLKEIGFEKEQSNIQEEIAPHFSLSGGDLYGTSRMSQVKILVVEADVDNMVFICKKQDDRLVIIWNIYQVGILYEPFPNPIPPMDHSDTNFLTNEDEDSIPLTYEEGFNLILDKIREAWKLNTTT